ncbi:MAG TPA: hypothetical protein VLJ59_21235 [Mycobacteriales bacterium]|nr:hypothetical protein [Mycobacteriales bacterium]
MIAPNGLAVALVLAQTLAVWYTTGFVWTLQLVDYPMAGRLRRSARAAETYMTAHNELFWRVLGPGLAVAGGSSVALLAVRPEGVPVQAAVAGVALLALIMVLSGRAATPHRARLARHYAISVHDRLLKVSWVRTAAFTAWGAMDALLLWGLLR